MKRLKNCWEVMKCGFGPNGSKAKTRSKVCHAAEEITLDGVHDGLQGGRVCWFVDNTLSCSKDTPGGFSEKFPICMNCKFYWKVKKEKDNRFEVSLLLHTYLQNK